MDIAVLGVFLVALFKIPAGNVELMARRVEDLLSDRKLAQAMGSAGRARAESEFSISACVAATVAIYDTLLTKSNRRATAT